MNANVSVYGSLEKALAALGANGGIIVVDKPLELTAAFAPSSNVIISGIPGAVIAQTNPTANVFELYQGQAGCQFVGLTATGGRSLVSGFGCPDTVVAGCNISGAHFRGLDFGAGAKNLVIRQNVILAFAAGAVDGIFCEDVGSGLSIYSNYLYSSVSTHGIAVHTSGGSIDAPQVNGNAIHHSGENFAIEIGKFNSGNRIAGASVSHNYISVAGGCGAISFSSADMARVIANGIDLNGITPSIQAIEFADVGYGSIQMNAVARNGVNGGAIILDSSSFCLVRGNEVSGYISAVNSGTFAGNLRVQRNRVSRNTLTIPDGSTRSWAFFVQANVAGCAADRNRFTGNTIYSSVEGMSVIHIENDNAASSTVTGTVDAGNVIANPPKS